MANKKQQLPKDDAVNVADSVAETPEQQKTTLTQKTKQAFASFGGKVKGLFVKDKKTGNARTQVGRTGCFLSRRFA